MQHPFDNFLRARILLGDTDDDILAACTTYRLFFAGDAQDHLRAVRHALSAVSPAIARLLAWDGTGTPPRKPTKRTLQKALLDARMVITPQADIVQEVLALRYRKHIATAIEVMSLAGSTLAEMTVILEKNYHYAIAARTITCYAFYFWGGTEMLPHSYGQYIYAVAKHPDMSPHYEALTDTDAVLSRLNLKQKFALDTEITMTLMQGYGILRAKMRALEGEASRDAQSWMRSLAAMTQVFLATGEADAEEIEAMFRFRLEEDVSHDLIRTMADIGVDPADAHADGHTDSHTTDPPAT